MIPQVRFPVAKRVDDPGRVSYLLHDGDRALNGILAGRDRRGVSTLAERIVRGARANDTVVHYIGPDTHPTPTLQRLAKQGFIGSFDSATDEYLSLVHARERSPKAARPPILVVLDHAELVFTHYYGLWEYIAITGPAVDLSVLALTDSIRPPVFRTWLLRDRLAADNLFHLRTDSVDDEAAAADCLRDAQLSALPDSAGLAHGYARSGTERPQAFSLELPED